MERTKHHPEIDYEIMVVGGGPAGISTWLHLREKNPDLASRVILIEKEKYPRDKLCGGAIHKQITNKIFSYLGIEMKVPYVPIDNVEIRFEKNVYTYQEENFFRIVRRLEFDHYLAQIAKDRGLHLKENETFIDVDYLDDGILVQTNRGSYKVKMIVGADGALSAVRTKMTPRRTPRFAATIELFSPVNLQYDPEFASHTAVMDFTAVNKGLQGYVWHFPCLDNQKSFMNHGICDTRIYPDVPRVDLSKIFSEELQTRHMKPDRKSWSGHPVTYFVDDPPLSQPHLLLVGDAAGIEPLFGGGIHLALAYGEVAATTIMDAFRRNDFSLKSYTQNVHNHYLGRYIKKLTDTAKLVYRDKTKILDSVSRIIESKK